jgi:hypothetical protein
VRPVKAVNLMESGDGPVGRYEIQGRRSEHGIAARDGVRLASANDRSTASEIADAMVAGFMFYWKHAGSLTIRAIVMIEAARDFQDAIQNRKRRAWPR